MIGKISLIAILISFLLSFHLTGCVTDPKDPVFEGDSLHSLRIVSPNGNEIYNIGDTIPLEYRVGDDVPGACLVFEYSPNKGENWVIVPGVGRLDNPSSQECVDAGDSAPDLGFIIPDTVSITQYDSESGKWINEKIDAVSSNWLMRVYEYNERDIKDRSDTTFTVKEKG